MKTCHMKDFTIYIQLHYTIYIHLYCTILKCFQKFTKWTSFDLPGNEVWENIYLAKQIKSSTGCKIAWILNGSSDSFLIFRKLDSGNRCKILNTSHIISWAISYFWETNNWFKQWLNLQKLNLGKWWGFHFSLMLFNI